MINNYKSRNLGFTLIELMVIMVIIGVLISVGLVNFTSSQKKSRDLKRKSDLRQIATVLEAYYNDKGKYPNSDASGKIMGCGAGDTGECVWGATMTDVNGTIYMQKLPNDTANYRKYFYSVGGGNKSFQIYALLENSEDIGIPRDGNGNPLSYPNTNCSTQATLLCNFGLSSSNTSPEAGRTPQ